MGQVWVLCLALDVALMPEEWCVEVLQGGQEMLAVNGMVVPLNKNGPGYLSYSLSWHGGTTSKLGPS